MIRKSVRIVLQRHGWLVPFLVLLVAISAYSREGRISIGGLFASALVATALLLMAKVPGEIRRLEAERDLLSKR